MIHTVWIILDGALSNELFVAKIKFQETEILLDFLYSILFVLKSNKKSVDVLFFI